MGLEKLDTILAFAAVMLVLSLLITIGVQMVIAVMGLRAGNLKWGIDRLLQQLDPQLQLGGISKALTKRITRHPAVAKGFRGATAIRPEELIKVLEDIALRAPAPAPAGAAAGAAPAAKQNALVGGWRVLVGFLRQEPPDDSAISTAVTDALNKLVPTQGAVDTKQAAVIVDAMLKIFPTAHGTIQQIAVQALGTQRQLEAEVRKWFETVMDRSTERFVLHTRWVTAALALVACVVLHIDAIAIMRQLTTDANVRNQIVQSTGALMDRVAADESLFDQDGGAALATMAIKKMAPPGEAEQQAITDLNETLRTRQQGRSWVMVHLSAWSEAAAAYESSFDTVARERVAKLGAAFAEMKGVLGTMSSQLVIVSDPRTAPGYTFLHIVGVLITVLLLSLGAPFWFNLLKQLSALRPVIAGKIDQEKKATAQA